MKIDPIQIVHSLSRPQVLEVQDVFNDLYLILRLNPKPQKRMKLYLNKKKLNSSGKVKKVFAMMASGDNLENGVINHVDDHLYHHKIK